MGNACTKAGREEASFLTAVKDGDCRTVQLAIIHNVEWAYKVQTWNGQTVFHLAARYGRIDVLETVVEAVRFNPAGPEKWSRLLRMGHSTDALLCSFSNLPDTRCQSPLHLAAIYGHSEVAERLLQLGASPWCWDVLGGRTPLHYAASMGHVDVIRVMLSYNSVKPEREALRRPNSARTRLVDVCNDSGYTPLHYAVWADNAPAVRALTSFEASLSARNVSCGSDWVVSCLKCTPLHLAAHKGNMEIVKLLLSAYVQTQPQQSTEGQHTHDRRRRDPRRHVNANRQLPYHMAVNRGHQHLSEVLHPDVPFSFVLTPAEMQTRLYGVAKLAVLASRALQAKLVSDIDNAVAAMRTAAPAAALSTNSRTRSGSIAALSGAVLTAVVSQAGGPAVAHHVLAAATARLRAAGERSAASARASMDLASATGAAMDAVPSYVPGSGASLVALRNVGRQASVQGSSPRAGVGSNRASIDNFFAAAAAAATLTPAAAGQTAAGTGAAAPAVGGSGANSDGVWQVVQAAALAPLGDGSVVGVAAGGLKAASAPDSAGSSATTSDKEALPVEPVSAPQQDLATSSRSLTAPAAAPPLDANSNTAQPNALPLPPAPISPFLPTPSGAHATSGLSVGGSGGGPCAPPRPPTFNEAASAFALFAAEPFDEQTGASPAPGGQGVGLLPSGSASINLAALARSRVQQQAMHQELASALVGGGGGGGGELVRQLTAGGSTSVNLAVLARNRAGGAGGGNNNNTAAPPRSARLRNLLIGRHRRSNTGMSGGNVLTGPDANSEADDLDDILYAMRPADDETESTTTHSAPSNVIPSTTAAAIATEENTSARAPPSPFPAAQSRQRAGVASFWRRGTGGGASGNSNTGASTGTGATGSANSTGVQVDILHAEPTAMSPLPAPAAAVATTATTSSAAPTPQRVDPTTQAHANGGGGGVTGLSGGPAPLIATAASLEGAAGARSGPAEVLPPGVIETVPSASLEGVLRSNLPRLASNGAADPFATAADSSFGDGSTRRRNSISIAALARRDVRVETVGPEMAAASAACTAQPADGSVMAMLSSLVEAPQHVLRRYRLLQLTHGLDLHDLLREHSQRGGLGGGEGNEGSAGVGVAAAAAGCVPPTGSTPVVRVDAVGLASGVTDWSLQSFFAGISGPPGPAVSAVGSAVKSGVPGTVATWLAQEDGAEGPARAVPPSASVLSIPSATGLIAGGGGGAGGAVASLEAVTLPALSPSPPPLPSVCSAFTAATMDAPQGVGLGSSVSAFGIVSGVHPPVAPVGFPSAAAAAAAAAGNTPGQLAGQLLRTLSSAAASESGEGVCGVCFDLPDKLSIVGCGHRLCSDCSRELCKMNGLKPALCPFCRGMIGGFKFAGK